MKLLDESYYNEDALMEKLLVNMGVNEEVKSSFDDLSFISYALGESMYRTQPLTQSERESLRKRIYSLIVINYIKTYQLYRFVVFQIPTPLIQGKLSDLIYQGSDNEVQELCRGVPALERFLLDPDLLWLYEESVRLHASYRLFEIKGELKGRIFKERYWTVREKLKELLSFLFIKKPEFQPELSPEDHLLERRGK